VKIELTNVEARVLGSLIEKEVTTPDQYPLSLNALTLACNQKTSREPVMELPEAQVQATIDALQKKHLVFERSGFGSRVPKYQQRLCGTEFSELKLGAQERALLCVLLLRGAQTSGELRTRTARLAEFADVAEVERMLDSLANRPAQPLVVRLARAAGEREARYIQLLTGAAPDAAVANAAHPGAVGPNAAAATAAGPHTAGPNLAGSDAATPDAAAPLGHDALAAEVARLRADVDELRRQLTSLQAQRPG
jgi:uncharacterized protein